MKIAAAVLFLGVLFVLAGTADYADDLDRESQAKVDRVCREIIETHMHRISTVFDKAPEPPLLSMPIPCQRGWVSGSSDGKPWHGRCL